MRVKKILLALALAGTLLGVYSCQDEVPSITPTYGVQRPVGSLYGKWTLDVDGMAELHLGSLTLCLDKTNSHIDVEIINPETKQLVRSSAPINKWELVKNYEGLNEKGLAGDAIHISNGGVDTYYFIDEISDDSLRLTTYQPLVADTVISFVAYRTESPYNKAEAITMTDAEVRDYCDSLSVMAEKALQDLGQHEDTVVIDTTGIMQVKHKSARSSANLWMSELPDDLLLCNMAIPGTHDSWTRGTSTIMAFGARSQAYNADELWDMGVRLFDMRIRDFQEEKAQYNKIYHGNVDCNARVSNELDMLFSRTRHSGEVTFLLINTESNPLGAWWGRLIDAVGEFVTFGGLGMNPDPLHPIESRKMMAEELNEAIRKYSTPGDSALILYRPDLTLGEARGKIIVINRLSDKYSENHYPFVGNGTENFGLWVDLKNSKDTTVLRHSMYVNDLYSQDEGESDDRFYYRKFDEFRQIYKMSNEQRVKGMHNNTLFFNSLSSSLLDGGTPVPDYISTAHNIHPKAVNLMKIMRGCGIISMDFAGADEYFRMSLGAVIGTAVGCVAACIATSILTYGMIPATLSVPASLNAAFAMAYAIGTANGTSVYGRQVLQEVIHQNFIPVPLERIELSQQILMDEPDTQDTIKVKFIPLDADDHLVDHWESDNEKVATVNNDGIVKIKGWGNARLTMVTGQGRRAVAYVVASETRARSVDMGLSVKWADRNLGAASASNTGFIYQWGETGLQAVYNDSTYIHTNASGDFTHYNAKDNLRQLNLAHDAAYMMPDNTKKTWRMPTVEEVRELFDPAKTICTKDVKDGVPGVSVKSIKTGAAIFLPITGYYKGNDLAPESMSGGYFWTSSIFQDATVKWDQAHALMVMPDENGFIGTVNLPRQCGLAIRPVRTK